MHVAYWTVGDGPVDLVFVPEWITFIEALWSVPSYARLWERLGSIGRLILTDARGSGSSDPAPLADRATFHHAVDDLVAVLDAVGSPRAFLIGHTYASAMMACLFAALHPDRTAGLILAGGTASYLDGGDGFGHSRSTRCSLGLRRQPLGVILKGSTFLGRCRDQVGRKSAAERPASSEWP